VLKTDILLNSIITKDNKCNNKLFRHVMQCSVNSRDRSYWNGLFDSINWETVWTYYKKFLINNKVHDVDFKMMHLIYPTNHLLKKYRSDLSESCILCNTETETIVHLFHECIDVRFLWIDVEN